MSSGRLGGRSGVNWILVPDPPGEPERLARLARFQKWGAPLTGLSMGVIAGILALIQVPGNGGWAPESRAELFLAVVAIVALIGFALSRYMLNAVSAQASFSVRRLAVTPLDLVLETPTGMEFRGRRDNMRVIPARDGGWAWVNLPTGSGTLAFRLPPEVAERLTREPESLA